MKKHLTTLMALVAALVVPWSAMAQDAESQVSASDIFGASAEESTVASDTTEAPKAEESASESKEDTATAAVASDAKDKKDDKGWGVGAAVSFDLGLGAFTKHEYARKIRSRFMFAINGYYTIPVIDVDIHAETGFTQWMSKAGGTNGQYEFRWADSSIGLSRNIWNYKSGAFGVSFDADLSFLLPTSKASINTDLYTSIIPAVSASLKLDKFTFVYHIQYAHNFHKYTSTTLNPNEVDVLSRRTGVELIGNNTVAVDGVLTECELANQFIFAYQFIKQFGMTVGLGFADTWTYDNGTITKDDDLVAPNAKVGRGHSQFSMGTVSLTYTPIDYVGITFTMVSTQPWKTADNRTLRFPWFDTVSPSKNFTKFMIGATFSY